MKHRDCNGRYQMTRYYTGRLEKDRMVVQQEGWFDFGSNFYAVQTFEKDGKRIAVGWISDFYNEYEPVEDGPVGSIAIPRLLSIKKGMLNIEPVPQIYTQKRECLGKETEANLSIHIPGGGNSYYAKVVLKEQGSLKFRILLAKGKDSRLWLLSDGFSVRIFTEGTKTEDIGFSVEIRPWEIEIFMDRRVVEVFVNQGQTAGTKIFCCDRTDTIFQTDFEEVNEVKSVEVYKMESVWAIKK